MNQDYINTHFDELMTGIQKPARYIGGEVNAVVKPRTGNETVFAFAFPDLYEIGMSHVGMQIIYNILNAMDGVACERVFAPGVDFKERLRERGVPLFTLESKQPLTTCHFIGFSLQYELQFTNVLAMLSLANIPLKASERNATHPIIIAGGPCAVNPEPMAPFFDVIVIGDGEAVLPKIVAEYRRTNAGPGGDTVRGAFFDAISGFDGVYIPARSAAGRTIRKSVVRDLESAPFPDRPVVPSTRVIHERANVEVMRGCPRRCRFCQARHVYWPVRFRSPETVKRLARSIIENTGYDELSMQSLSIGDYPPVEEVLCALEAEFSKERVSIALPSLRVERILGMLTTYASKVRKTGLTFAIEAGSQELRDSIAKDIDVSIVKQLVEQLVVKGCDSMKLYFMIGLPGETMQDVEKIVLFIDELLAIARTHGRRRVQVNAGVSTFVPKPHTDFEREALATREDIDAKQAWLRSAVGHKKNVKMSLTSYDITEVEAVLSRGDRRTADMIYTAWQEGAYLDAWSEHFRADVWRMVIDANAAYVASRIYVKPADGEVLPWDFIDCRPAVHK